MIEEEIFCEKEKNDLLVGKNLVRLYKNLDSGCVEVWKKEDEIWERAMPRISKTSGYVYFMIEGKPIYYHMIVMGWFCGWKSIRIGYKNEIHHLNRNRLDNNVSNLICLSSKQHHRLHRLFDLFEKSEDSDEQSMIKGEIDDIISAAVLLRDRCMKKRARILKIRREDENVE